MSTICFYAQFTALRAGLDGLTVTWDVERVTRSDGTRSALVTGGANSITVGRRGLYGYVLTGADLHTYDYIATAITTSTTADVKEVPAIWTLFSLNDNLDATVSSRSSHSAADVWTSATRTLSSYGTLIADIWASLTSGMATVGSIGKRIADNLDAAITSRLASAGYTSPDNASITAIKVKTDNLPTDPADQSAVEAAITAATSPLATALNLSNLDTYVSVFVAKTAEITAMRGADNDTLKTLSDQIDSIPNLGSGAIPTTVTVTDGVNPLDGVDVWLATDSAGTNIIHRGYTNALGNIVFSLDVGTYYVFKQLAGYSFTNPETLTVS